MYRIDIQKLNKWKTSKHRKPLIIEGAHQVGNERFAELLDIGYHRGGKLFTKLISCVIIG